jgi:cobalamin synthase
MLLAGAVTLVVVAGHALDLPVFVAALLALGAAILGNRAFHLDGHSDIVDGMAASYDRERSLEAMKSGTSGPAGVVAIVLVLGLQAAGLVAVLTSVVVLMWLACPAVLSLGGVTGDVFGASIELALATLLVGLS